MFEFCYPDRLTLAEARRHLALTIEYGLVDGEIEVHDVTGLVVVRGLTQKGHDFLDAIRNDTFWNQVLARLKQEGPACAVKLIFLLGWKLLKGSLGH